MRAPFTLCTPLCTMLPSHHLSPGDARQQCALPSLRGRQPALHCLGGRGRAVEPAPLLRRTAIASAIAASATGQPRWPPPLRPMATAARPPLRLGPCATRRAPHSQHAGRRVACALRARCGDGGWGSDAHAQPRAGAATHDRCGGGGDAGCGWDVVECAHASMPRLRDRDIAHERCCARASSSRRVRFNRVRNYTFFSQNLKPIATVSTHDSSRLAVPVCCEV